MPSAFRTNSPPQPHRPPLDAPRTHLDPHRHKRRFVSEGEVPVTVLPPTGRRTSSEDTERLEAERHAREAAERALAEAQTTIRDLQTRLAHAEIAAREAQASAAAERRRAEDAAAAEHEARQRIEALQAEIASSNQPAPRKTKAPRRPASRQASPPPLKQPAPLKQKTRQPDRSPPKRSHSKVAAKPVKWWVKGRKTAKD